ncbi:molybdopterin-dependent oxidoreductase [Marinimicrobium sp. C6131]|uniref:nitrate reductase n=1 Tax=Marinimicrobium sp. C6131 TaxID=3022676 RepID=UPI00223E38FA|nr:nitrate reductase [Marinimicrobium sp. C6131]UZJ44070.1 molybdopterin-dependent oxidoreductase [Marinimicrobium sp. C6131]
MTVHRYEPIPIAQAESTVQTTCAYCGVGCGIKATVNTEERKVLIEGDETHPANFGRLCSKGLALGETLVDAGRLLHPKVHGEQTSWNRALQTVAQGFVDTIVEHGPDSVAFYVSGQLLTEDYYLANKLMKGFIGSGNIDTNSRLCMSSSVAGHKRAFGSDTVPGCYTDLEQADMIVLTGSNLAWCHPVLFQRIKAAKQQRPHMKVVVIDPRRTDTCDIADLHLPIHPGTDVALFNGLLSYLAQHNAIDEDFVQAHTEHFTEALVAAMEDAGQRPALAQQLGVADYQLETFFQWYAQTEKTVTVYSQGVNQSTAGTDKVNAIINCHLATGRIGRPGVGPFSVTGQPNAMGGREVGGLANTLAAHMEFDNPEHWQLVRDFWEADNLATRPGLKAVDMFDAVASGKIKAIWIMATNPVMSLPNADKVKQALKDCPLVVVSDCIEDTDTTRLADVLLPAAGWAEKSGTVTNSERRISRQRALLPPLGEARPDWWIIAAVAKQMGYGRAFDYASEAEVFSEYARLTATDNNGTRDLDLGHYSHLTLNDYDSLLPRQWPLPTKAPLPDGDQRLFGDGVFFTPSGRGRFVSVRYRAPATGVDSHYPLTLNTGRIRDQWHSMTRTGLASRLCGHLPEPFISIHPKDAGRYQLKDGALADVTSRQGQARVRVQLTDQVNLGEVFMPMHWNDVHASRARVAALVGEYVDPTSGQPENKYTPVQVQPWYEQAEALLVSRTPLPELEADYWAMRRVNGGYLYRIASERLATDLDKQLQSLCQDGDQQLAFGHPEHGEFRRAFVREGQLHTAFSVAKQFGTRDFNWLGDLLEGDFAATAMRALLSGKPDRQHSQGKLVCACKQVGYNTLCSAIREKGIDTVDALSAETTAGTGCGSCLPELEQIIARESAHEAA